MRTLFASTALFAAAYAVELGSGATQAEHEAFLGFLASSGQTVA